ncbi:MAG: hypothetical protein KBA30_06720 [Clostridia bacterium]|nr:hypothetical protein [Clostridia bacterium]
MTDGTGDRTVWYHGSNLELQTLRTGSTVTRWRELAEAFSHKPAMLSIADDGGILHTGTEPGILYEIAEPVSLGREVVPHPRTTMGEGLEWLTTRPLALRRIDCSPGLSRAAADAVMERIREGAPGRKDTP